MFLEEEKRILENILLNFVKLGIMMYSYHPGASTSPMVSIQLTMARRYDLGQPQSYICMVLFDMSHVVSQMLKTLK